MRKILVLFCSFCFLVTVVLLPSSAATSDASGFTALWQQIKPQLDSLPIGYMAKLSLKSEVKKALVNLYEDVPNIAISPERVLTLVNTAVEAELSPKEAAQVVEVVSRTENSSLPREQ